MFTGIIESTGKISSIESEKSNLNFWIESAISKDLKVDQSVSHNGCCLTITECNSEAHKVTIVKAVEWDPWASADYIADHNTSMTMSMIIYDLEGTPRMPKD